MGGGKFRGGGYAFALINCPADWKGIVSIFEFQVSSCVCRGSVDHRNLSISLNVNDWSPYVSRNASIIFAKAG